MDTKPALEAGDAFVFHGGHYELVYVERQSPTQLWTPVVRKIPEPGFTHDGSHREVR